MSYSTSALFTVAVSRTLGLASFAIVFASYAAMAAPPKDLPRNIAYVAADRVMGSPNFADGPRLFFIDVDSDTVLGEPITLGSAQDVPAGGVELSPGGRFAYVGVGRYVIGTPGGNDDQRVVVVDTMTRQVLHSFQASNPVTAGGTGAIALTPDGGTLYAYRGYDGALGTVALAAMSLPSGEVRSLVALPHASSGRVVAVSPNGLWVVAPASWGTGIAIIDRRTNALVDTVSFEGDLRGAVFSPDSNAVYVTVRDAGGGRVVRVSIPGRGVTNTLALGESYPSPPAISPDGRRVYVVDNPTVGQGKLYVVNTDLWQLAASPFAGTNPGSVSVVASGEKLYVSHWNGPVSVFSTQTNTLIKTIDGLPLGVSSPVVGKSFMPPSVEYFHQGFGHYFTTSNPSEVDKLDAGDFVSWSRTGEWFNVLPASASGAVAVCRFFSDAFSGKSSHFYAPKGLGCEDAMSNRDWQYEGDVFQARLPSAEGACQGSDTPLYRVYNNGQGGAPNHRFTTSLSVRAAMLDQGWIAEGSGIGVGMCVAR